MNLHLRPRSALALLFILVSLGSVGYVVAVAMNYASFYPALSTLNLQVERIGVERDPGSGNLLLRVNIAISNPGGYSGFRVYAFDLKVFFVHRHLSNNSLFQDQPLLASQTLGKPLGPRSTIDSDTSIVLLSQQSASFSQFNETYPGEVAARTTLRVQFNTFLDPVIGRVVIERAGDFALS